MSAPIDTTEKFQAYVHGDKLVSVDWVKKHQYDANVAIVESDEDVLLYETGHIPGAVKIDWHTDLNDPVVRDYIDGAAFAALLSARGISRDTTVVIYGDKSNWWAAYALWVFELFGHPDVRLLDGGRDKWIALGNPLTRVVPHRATTEYPVVARDDSGSRVYREQVLDHLGKPLIDVRSPEEYVGERTAPAAYPEEGALRAGHIPGAENVPWGRAVNEDGTFASRADLERIYREDASLRPDDDIVVYCRIGERSSHSWFVLKYLLGFTNVRNYDGSWTEWGSSVRVPISQGEAA